MISVVAGTSTWRTDLGPRSAWCMGGPCWMGSVRGPLIACAGTRAFRKGTHQCFTRATRPVYKKTLTLIPQQIFNNSFATGDLKQIAALGEQTALKQGAAPSLLQLRVAWPAPPTLLRHFVQPFSHHLSSFRHLVDHLCYAPSHFHHPELAAGLQIHEQVPLEAACAPRASPLPIPVESL